MRVDLPLDKKTVENQDWATGPAFSKTHVQSTESSANKVQFLVQGFLPQFNHYCHLKHRITPPPAFQGMLLVALFSPSLVHI